MGMCSPLCEDDITTFLVSWSSRCLVSVLLDGLCLVILLFLGLKFSLQSKVKMVILKHKPCLCNFKELIELCKLFYFL